jgi:hypothetical protein
MGGERGEVAGAADDRRGAACLGRRAQRRWRPARRRGAVDDGGDEAIAVPVGRLDDPDGCEVNVNTDPNNCGNCGAVCNGTNGTRSCSAGTCQIACNAGWGNCDGNVANGCESNLNGNGHCGICNNACSGGTSCIAGICQ